MRDKVSTELKGMLALDLIEPTDASPWVSNLVILQKRSGGIRPCFDLWGPNKAVVPDKYPLPTIEELTTLFYSPIHTARWSRKIARKLPECLLCERKHVPGLIPGLIPGWGPSNIAGFSPGTSPV